MSLGLTDQEATVLAYRVALNQLARELEWEDYPHLNEQAFIEVDRHVRETVSEYLRDAVRLQEKTWDIDGANLMELAT